jgi:hypothetical protein
MIPVPHAGLRVKLKELIGACLAVNSKCIYCSAILNIKILSIDHKLPLERGGNSNIENLQAICRFCNERKGALTHEEYNSLCECLAVLDPYAKRNVLSRLRAGARRIYGRV